MHGEEIGQEKSQILHKLLVPRVALRICRLEIHLDGYDGGYRGQDLCEHLDKLFVVVVAAWPSCLQTSNLRQALECHISEFGHLQEASSQQRNEVRLEDVAERDPVAEPEQRLQRRLDQTRLGGCVQNLLTELEDLRELITHCLLEISGLGRGHLLGRVVEHLLGQETQDNHVVFANRQARVTGLYDLIDEGWPVVRPFLLQHGDKHEVELVEQCALGP